MDRGVLLGKVPSLGKGSQPLIGDTLGEWQAGWEQLGEGNRLQWRLYNRHNLIRYWYIFQSQPCWAATNRLHVQGQWEIL